MKNVLKYILFGLLVSLCLYVLVSFIINKDGTMYWINYVLELLNKPLPIIGITTIALFVFIWNVVIFIRKNQPEKELIALRNEHNKYRNESEKEKQELKENNEKLLSYLKRICELSTNQKINNFVKELEHYGERNDSDAEKE